MEPIKIFRIEHPKDGQGIFKSSILDNYIVDTTYGHMLSIYFPTPLEEGLYRNKENKEWFCAFNNYSDIYEWLKTEDLEYLFKLGFNVLELEITNYQKGKYQTLYTKESIIKNINITNQFNINFKTINHDQTTN